MAKHVTFIHQIHPAYKGQRDISCVA